MEAENCLIFDQDSALCGFMCFLCSTFLDSPQLPLGFLCRRDQSGIMLVWSPDILYTQAISFQEVTSRVSQTSELTSPLCPRGDSLMLELMWSVQPSSPSSCQPWLCTLEFQVLSQKLTFTLRTKTNKTQINLLTK